MSISDKLLVRNKILGVLIRDARLARGKIQDECAIFLGISPGRFSEMEYGARPISLPELEAFAYLVDIPVEHFFGDQLLKTNGKKQIATENLLALRNRVVGVLLQQARTTAGVTLEACAEHLRIPAGQIAAYESGQTAVPLAELEALSQLFQVPLETFLDDEHNPISKLRQPPPANDPLSHLSPELRAFVLEPLNADYVRTALNLSKMPTEQLRAIAETLLEITY